MTILIFIIILIVLVVGHELGHFVVAKLAGMKVPEFGLGFPPRLFAKKIGDTEYSVNALLLGGFVKIRGEDMEEGERMRADPTSFSGRPKYLQAATLVAGPFMNILIAFVLSSSAFMLGVPAATDSGFPAGAVKDPHVTVVGVIPGSPAEKSGIHEGDRLVSFMIGGEAHPITKPEDIGTLVENAGGPIGISLMRNGAPVLLDVSPESGVVPGAPEQKALGIATAEVGTLALPFTEALAAGFDETVRNMGAIFTGILSLIGSAFTLSASLAGVAGPVGIAGLVGSAATFGLGSLLSFAALISVNLGIINLFPFPALDGGRLAMVFLEAISRRRIPAKVANTVNTVGFALLILLLLVVTFHDISRLMA